MSASIQPTRKGVALQVWLAVTAVLVLAGITAWGFQAQQGVGATELSSAQPWGLYVAGFIFFMGLSAGSLVLAALPLLFDLPRFRPYVGLTALVALSALLAGGLFILVDIGRPDRLFEMLTSAQLGSPMQWDLMLTVVYLIVSVLFVTGLVYERDDAWLKPLAWVALFAGLADGLTGFVFATQVSHEFWFSAVQPMAFFVAALASGGAVLLVVLLTLHWRRAVILSVPDLTPLARLTAAALALDLMLLVSEVITLAFTRSEQALTLVQSMLASPLLWVEVVAGVAAIALLFRSRMTGAANALLLGAGFALVDLAIKRFLFVRMGFAIPNLGYPGAVPIRIAYVPNVIEWGVTLGLVALFSLVLSIGYTRLNRSFTTGR